MSFSALLRTDTTWNTQVYGAYYSLKRKASMRFFAF